MQRILVAVDFSQGSRLALRAALELSQAFQAPLRVVHVLTAQLYGIEYAQMAGMQMADLAELDRSLKDFVLEGFKGESKELDRIERKVLQGTGAAQILEEAAWWHATLVVVGSQGRSALGRLLLGSVSSRVVSRAVTPVLVVRGTAEALPRKILAAVDGGPLTEKVLGAAFSWARKLEASLEVVHVLPVLPEEIPEAVFPDQDRHLSIKGILRQKQHDIAEALERAFPGQTPPPLAFRSGSPARQICACAEEGGHDLVVVGVHHKQDVLDLGNTAARVAHHCCASVLVMRKLPEGWESELSDDEAV